MSRSMKGGAPTPMQPGVMSSPKMAPQGAPTGGVPAPMGVAPPAAVPQQAAQTIAAHTNPMNAMPISHGLYRALR